jgi:pimeloyl-ACP methyl ester carboxylesterase
MNCNADVASDDIKALVEHYNVSKITLVGHDWGAGVAYR